MAIPYLSNIDLQQNEIQNAVVHNQASNPSTPIAGQIYYNTGTNKLLVYNGTEWLDTTGDIRKITAGAGLTGTADTGDVTLNIGQGNGITVAADTIAVNAEATQFSFVSGVLTITDGAIGSAELAATGVTANSYGSATAIPTFTVDADGRLTAAGEVGITTTLTVDADGATTANVSLADDDLQILGTANEIETTVSKTGTDVQVVIGLPSDVTISNDLFVLGNLQVTGTTTTSNVETVSTSNGVIFEGTVADANELTLLAGVLTADRTVTLPDASGTVALLSDINDATLTVEGTSGLTGSGTFTANDADTTTITLSHADTSSVSNVDNSGLNVIQDLTFDGFGHVQTVGSQDITTSVDARITNREYAATIGDGINTSYSISAATHNLGNTLQILVQLYDVTSGATVYADVVRNTTTYAVEISFSSAPSTNAIGVLMTKIG